MHGSLQCTNSTLPTITVSFTIMRMIPGTVSEQLYFVHHYIQRLDEIVMVSVSTSTQDNLSIANNLISTISCIAPADL